MIVLEIQQPKFAIMSSSAHVRIFNECDGIALISRQCIVFKGEYKSGEFKPITPGNQDKIIIKSFKPLLGRSECCLLYEIAKESDHQAPLIWGSRVFMVINLSINPHQVEERKVAVKLISVKSHKFKGTKEEVKDLHKKVLCHFMHNCGQNSQWNLEKLGLNLNVNFDREAQAVLYVYLSRSNVIPDDTPIFYSYGDFM
jgi:hypothetical protein